MRLDPAEAARIESAFDAAQLKTRAPIVCVLASASLASEAEFLLGAAVLALAAPLPLLLFSGMSAQRIYIAQLLVAILAAVVGSLPWTQRLLVPKRVQRAVCHRAALTQFVLRGLDRSQCGALVYVSLAERYIRNRPGGRRGSSRVARAVAARRRRSARPARGRRAGAGADRPRWTMRRTARSIFSARRDIDAAAAAALSSDLKALGRGR